MSAGVFSPLEEKEGKKNHEWMEEGETIGLYPKGGLMVIKETKLSDKNAKRYIEKIQNPEEECKPGQTRGDHDQLKGQR